MTAQAVVQMEILKYYSNNTVCAQFTVVWYTICIVYVVCKYVEFTQI